MTKTLTAVVHREEKIYIAQCPEVGTVSQGESVESALANLKEATELTREEFPLPEISLQTTTTWKQKDKSSKET